MMFAQAFSPSGISSFFEVCTHRSDGTPISDPAEIGAKGGGFALTEGVLSAVTVKRSDSTNIEVLINKKQCETAETTKTIITQILQTQKNQYSIIVEHTLNIPIGAGFGTSAAGALSCGLALASALKLPLTYNQIARAAHVADVLCNTGLGTVEGLTVGGLVLVVKSGSIGHGLVDRIPLKPDLRIVAGVFESMDKRSVLLSSDKVQAINSIAKKTMQIILNDPTPETFLDACQHFSRNSGLASKRVLTLIERIEQAGAIGATQNMIGEAVHALTDVHNLARVRNAFLESLEEERIIVSTIDFQGARLL